MSTLTAERLRELLHYDPETGVFTRLVTARRWKAGTIAGCHQPVGYSVIRVGPDLYLAHRLAWLYMTGEWPAGYIDHINLDKGDNRWANLRVATGTENIANRRLQKNNTTGYKGVTRNYRGFQAQIMIGGRNKNLGTFRTAHEAHAAYEKAAAEHFGQFANAG